MTAQDIWIRASQLIRKEVPDASYSTWFEAIEPLYLKGNRMTLGVPNVFSKNILSTRYMPLLSNAVSKSANLALQVELVTGEEGFINRDKEDIPSRLYDKYTFQTFVIGNSNRFAHAAAVAVAETPAQAYNPLFIYGGVGLGKTHLMHAIGHQIKQNNPSAKVLYISSETFTNELITAISTNTNVEFRNRFRGLDVLLVDDIQFIAGREQTQEEFFHTFNTLHDAGKQIVISSDKQPKEIPTLEERLRSRFEWGLIADIQRPDLETRIAILRRKAQLESVDIPDEVNLFIATKIESNIRELEGSLTRVIAYSVLEKTPLSVELAQEALRDMLAIRDPKRITTDLIMAMVADYYSVSVEELKSKKRNREITVPRHIAIYLTRELTEASLPRIGGEFGGRDHSTILHACEKVATDVRNDSRVRTAVNDLKKRLQQ